VDPSAARLVAGRYRLLSRLGTGGMGTVWRARDEVLGREVAVKEVTFPPGLSDEDRSMLRERTRREARAAARLDHPSAVTVYDVVEHDGAPYLVMELVEAGTLADVVRSDGPLSPQRTAQVGLALLGALEAAHRQGIVHRDVKPSNVMVRDDGRVVLTDFGIATSTGDASLTHTGLLLGSPAYIAPERARGEAPGPPSDLWSLGATLFTAVEGRPPFEGDTPLTTVTAVVTGDRAPYVAAGPLAPVLDGLLAKDPAERLDAAGARPLLQDVADHGPAERTQVLAAPPDPGLRARTTALDVGEVRDELAIARPRPAAGPHPAAAPPVRPPRPRTPPPQRARPGWLVPLAAAAVLLGAAGAAVALATDDDGGERTTASPSASIGARASASAAPSTSAPAPAQEAPTAAAPAPSSAPPSPEPSPEATEAPPTTEPTSPAVEGVPAGWSTDTGAGGWTVALPPGYAQTRAGEYRDAETGRTLRIQTGQGRADAVADRQAAAQDFARRHPSYRELRIEPVDYRGYEAADWEFTYEGLHVINRVFVVDGTGHSLFFQTRAGDIDAARADFDRIAAAFAPAGA